MSENIILCVLEKQRDGITIADRRGARLRFADDTTLLRTSKELKEEFMALLKRVRQRSRRWWIKAEKGKRTSF